MTPPVERRRGAPRAAVPVALLLVACVGPQEVPPQPRESLSQEEFRDLLSKGLIEPVEALEGEDDAFREFEEEESDGLPEPSDQLQARIDELEARLAERDQGAEPTEPASEVATSPVQLHPENPFLTFGRRIIVYPDGTILKPYPLRAGTGEKMKLLIENYGNFPLWTPELGPGPSTVDTVKIELLPEHDIELYQDLRNPAFGPATKVALADWLLVTAGFDLLYEVEEFINLFAAGVPQIEIEAKIVEISFIDILDYGVTPVDSSTPIFDAPGDGTFIRQLDFSFPGLAEGSGGFLTLGGIFDGIAFNAVLEALASRDNVSIISQPKIAVREGGRAEIVNTDRIPITDITGINNTGGFNAKLDYLTVGVQLYVVPRVVGTDTVALNIDVEASQQSGEAPLVTTGSEVVTSPIVSTRSARTIVYLQPGEAVILGGLISERNVEQERKIPLLGDIPLLGYLFKSKLIQKEQTNVLFLIRPRILQGSDLHREF